MGDCDGRYKSRVLPRSQETRAARPKSAKLDRLNIARRQKDGETYWMGKEKQRWEQAKDDRPSDRTHDRLPSGTTLRPMAYDSVDVI